MTITRYTRDRRKEAILWEGRGVYYWNPSAQQWQKCTRDMADRITAGNRGNLPGRYQRFDDRNTAPTGGQSPRSFSS